jgi:hypothetical protein
MTRAKKRKPSKYRIGDLWVMQTLPLLTFVYTDLGWLMIERGLEGTLWIIEQAERLQRMGLGTKLYKSDKPPPGARRLADEDDE